MMHAFLTLPVTVWHAYLIYATVALHALASAVTSHIVLSALWDLAMPVGALTALTVALTAHPRTRRTSCALVKFTNRRMPRWAKPALVAAAFIPGQADEIVLVAILLIPILRNAYQRRVLARTVRYAWHTR